MKLPNIIHPDLIATQKLAYEPVGLAYTNLLLEVESQEYGACTFTINNKVIKFRVARITPTKIGQFVTLWKRIGIGPILPYDSADQFDLLVVTVRDGRNLGQFIFPKDVLIQQEVLSKAGVGGKRAMRVYPPWDITDNSQAVKTQSWQLLYFAWVQPHLDIAIIKKLYT